jgi:Na+/proline symporter
MWLFATPFYWLIAPIMRRLRVTTTGDVFGIRYGRGLEVLYTLVGLGFYVLSIAMLLRGAGAAISGATSGAIPTTWSVIVLAVVFSTYVMAGGLVAAAYTDYLQGVMIIVLSVMLVPAGLERIGGMTGLHESLPSTMLAITAPIGAKEGDPWFVLAMSIFSIVGIVTQPHVMTATASGKTELEARVGMTYGNFIKRFLTIAWAFTGIIALLVFPEVMAGLDPHSDAGHKASETLFGRAIQGLLGDGWRGLMIACLIAGVTSAETFMVVGSALFMMNLYQHFVRGRTDGHYLWMSRIASAGLLAAGILFAVLATSVTQLLNLALDLVGLLGPAFWLGVTWRRANTPGVWASFLGGLVIWLLTRFDPAPLAAIPVLGAAAASVASAGETLGLREVSRATQAMLMMGVEFSLLVGVSLMTRPQPAAVLDAFFARLLTPVGREPEVALEDPPSDLPAAATLGMHHVRLDYQKASRFGHPGLRRLGFEIPKVQRLDWTGFVGAWALVFALIGLLVWLSGLGRA